MQRQYHLIYIDKALNNFERILTFVEGGYVDHLGKTYYSCDSFLTANYHKIADVKTQLNENIYEQTKILGAVNQIYIEIDESKNKGYKLLIDKDVMEKLVQFKNSVTGIFEQDNESTAILSEDQIPITEQVEYELASAQDGELIAEDFTQDSFNPILPSELMFKENDQSVFEETPFDQTNEIPNFSTIEDLPAFVTSGILLQENDQEFSREMIDQNSGVSNSFAYKDLLTDFLAQKEKEEKSNTVLVDKYLSTFLNFQSSEEVRVAHQPEKLLPDVEIPLSHLKFRGNCVLNKETIKSFIFKLDAETQKYICDPIVCANISHETSEYRCKFCESSIRILNSNVKKKSEGVLREKYFNMQNKEHVYRIEITQTDMEKINQQLIGFVKNITVTTNVATTAATTEETSVIATSSQGIFGSHKRKAASTIEDSSTTKRQNSLDAPEHRN